MPTQYRFRKHEFWIQAIVALALFLSSCTNEVPITLEPTSTFQPTKTTLPTASVSPSTTPVPTSLEVATMVAFATLIVNVCPSTTPPPNQSEAPIPLSDTAIQREFTGSYSYGDGFGGEVLVIDCGNIFYLQRSTDVGRFPLEEGIVEVKNGEVILEGNDQSVIASSIVYIPVRWGLRRYLVEEDRIDAFCEKIVSTGFYKEPRGDDDFGIFLLRLHDDELDADGFPVLPSGEKICD